MGAGAVELTCLPFGLTGLNREHAGLVGTRFPGQGVTVAAVA